MKEIITFLLVFICLQTMSQRPAVVVKPTQIPTGNTVSNPNSVPINTAPVTPEHKALSPAQIQVQKKFQEKINEAIKEKKYADAKEACYQIINNATVTRVEVKFVGIPTSIPSTQAVFDDRKIVLSKYGSFLISASITGDPVRKEWRTQKDNKNGSYTTTGYYFDETYSFTPTKTTTYKDLYDNGFTCSMLLTGHKEWDFSCSYIQVIFYYSEPSMYYSEVTVTKALVAAKKGIDISVTQFINGKKLQINADPCGDWRPPSW